MIKRIIKQTILLGCLAVSVSGWARESPVKLEVVARTESHEVFAKNSAPNAMSVFVELTGTNLSADREWPQVFVIKPGATLSLGVVRGKEPRQGYRFNTRLSSQIGDYRAPDLSDVTYRLPYRDGEAYPMTQAFGGPLTSHSDPLMQQAIDFVMPEGTPVVAARDGIVVSIEQDFTTGGTDPYYFDKANQVTVQHSDGTIAVYVHLFPQSVQVSMGQPVRAGDMLAQSGNTGFSSGPHLHFALMKPKLGADKIFRLEALPVHFATGLPKRILVPVMGLLATAASDRPAKVVYQDIGNRRDDPDSAALHVVPPSEAYTPMPGDRPVIDTSPPVTRQSEASRKFWLKLAIWVWFALFIALYCISRVRKSRYLRDE